MEIKKDVHWLGVVDWGLREFHGHELSTHRGSTYNAYLIKDEKNVLIDTVWTPFEEEFISKLRGLINPEELDYIVVNHAEVDHAGSLKELVRLAPQAQIIASNRGAETIPGHHHEEWDIQTVSTGDTLDIGKRQLTFVEAPMLHWPDSMFTYLSDSNILFPNDAFGQHYATGYRFNDEVDEEELQEEALKYYVNILNPFSPMVSRKIDELKDMDLDIDMIAPSHGVIWRDNPMQIVEKYAEWAEQKGEQSAVILYDSMWQATAKMAKAIGEGMAEAGLDYKIIPAATTDRNDLLVEVFKAKTIVIGSSTINNGVLPTIAPLFSDLKGLKFKNKLGAAFGSYGWSGEGVALIEEHLQDSGIEKALEGIKCKWQPDEENLADCREFGKNLAEKTT